MTLSTDIYILDPIEPEAVFRRVREILTGIDPYCSPVDRHKIEERESYFGTDYLADGDDKPRLLQTSPGQGLPAWVMVEYRPGRPLRTEDDAVEERRREHDRDHAGGYCTVCPEGDGGRAPDDTVLADHFGRGYLRRCYLRINMDTTYGYRDHAGRGCGDLHAEIIRRLAPWLDEQEARFEWKNEYSGDVYWGTAGLETLTLTRRRR